MSHKIPVPKELWHYPQGISYALDTAGHRQGFLIHHGGNSHNNAYSRQGNENQMPAAKEQQLPTNNWCHNRCQSIYHHQNSIEGSQVSSLAHIPGNGPGDYNAAGTGQALYQPCCQKYINIIY